MGFFPVMDFIVTVRYQHFLKSTVWFKHKISHLFSYTFCKSSDVYKNRDFRFTSEKQLISFLFEFSIDTEIASGSSIQNYPPAVAIQQKMMENAAFKKPALPTTIS